MTMPGKGILVIPAFNEEESIREVISEIQAEKLGLDILVIDDGSSDRTLEHLRQFPVKVLSHPINLGYGAAVQTGFKYAASRDYDFLVLMDADGQHIPAQVRLLLEELGKGRDIVIGSRLAGSDRIYRFPMMRRAGIRFFSFLAWVLGGVRILDVTSGFQAMRRVVFLVLAEEYPVDFPDAEVIVMLGMKKFDVAEVPAVIRERVRGKSMYSSFGTVVYYPFKSFLASVIVLLRLFRERGGR